MNVWFNKINTWTNNNSVLSYLLLLLMAILFFSWLQLTPSFADPDSFYHVKISQMMAEQGVIHDFPYLQFTTLKNDYIDHHFLYHVFLVPFVKWLPPLIGVKIAHIILDSGLVLIFFWLLRRLKVNGAFWYSLLLFLCDGFMFRINLVKAQPVSIIVLFVGTYLILQKRYWLLFILSFFYVWAYGGWFLLLILAGIYILVSAFDSAISNYTIMVRMPIKQRAVVLGGVVAEGIKNIFQIDNVKLFSSVGAGLVAGIIINPYFPTNLNFYWVQIVEIGFKNFQGVIGVGAEWYPYDAFQLFKNAAIPLIFYILSLIIFISHYKKFNITAKFLFVTATFFLLATIRSRRNIEYMAPFIVIAGANLFADSFKLPAVKRDLLAIKKIFSNLLFSDKIVRVAFKTILFGCLLSVVVGVPVNIKRNLSNRINFNYLKGASEYVRDNSSEGDIVFNSGWDYWPELFYHNNKNYYIVGLDATFMYLHDSDLYWRWSDVINGKRKEEMYNIIKNDFKAKYVIVKVSQKKMIANLDNNFNFVKVYSDNEAVVYEVL